MSLQKLFGKIALSVKAGLVIPIVICLVFINGYVFLVYIKICIVRNVKKGTFIPISPDHDLPSVTKY